MERTRTVEWRDLAPGLDWIRRLSGIDYLRAIASGEAPPPPLALLLGFRLEDISEGHVVVAVDPAEFHYNPLGVAHGGLAATLFDSALGSAVQSLLPPGHVAPTLQLHVNYLRPITEATGRISCSGSVVHLGKRSATAEGRITDSAGELYAHATGTFLVRSSEAGDNQ